MPIMRGDCVMPGVFPRACNERAHRGRLSAAWPLALALIGCTGGESTRVLVEVPVSTGGTSSGGSNDATGGLSGTSTPPPPQSTTPGPVITPPPTTGEEGGSCEKVSCTPPGGRYCGIIGDGCRGELDCGECEGDATCEDGICVGGPSCIRLTCTPEGGRYCGLVGDGCGGTLDCGECPSGQTCTGGVCTTPGCVPLTCETMGGEFCGEVGDGCGGTIECGECTAPKTCGGGGMPNVCGDSTSCEPISCTTESGGRYCGEIGNGCGGTIDCGECPDGDVGGGMGIPNVCPTGPLCSGIECDVEACPNGGTTSVSGVVYDPSGTIPLYNARVYVPNGPLDPIE